MLFLEAPGGICFPALSRFQSLPISFALWFTSIFKASNIAYSNLFLSVTLLLLSHWLLFDCYCIPITRSPVIKSGQSRISPHVRTHNLIMSSESLLPYKLTFIPGIGCGHLGRRSHYSSYHIIFKFSLSDRNT